MYEKYKARGYFCDLCGRSVTLLPERRGYGAPRYYLPNGWTGSYRRRGCCLCPECSEAFRTALKSNKVEYEPVEEDGSDDTD